MILDIEKLAAAQVIEEPYPHFAVPYFIPKQYLARAIAEYPNLDMAGVFPLDTIKDSGPLFKQIVAEMRSEAVRDIIAQKFDMDLGDHGTMLTIRACAQANRDGKVHQDATFKKATLLLYINEEDWKHQGGNLRILRSNNVNDYAFECSPAASTLLVFKCVENCWHGHLPFEGKRRYIMMNYCLDKKMIESEERRHRISARFKRLRRALGLSKTYT